MSELKFDVDSTKLEPTIQNKDLGIQFSSPKGWTLMSQDLFGEFSKRLPQFNVEGSGLRNKPNSIFLNRENKIILDIFRIHVLGDLTSTDNYKDLVQKTFSTIKIGDLTKRKGVDKNTIYFSYLTQLKNLYSIRGTHLSTSLLKYWGSHISI